LDRGTLVAKHRLARATRDYGTVEQLLGKTQLSRVGGFDRFE
jgi:hypothetical protein